MPSEQSPERKPPGRKFGLLRGPTEEYNALARFLRGCVEKAGLRLEDLTDATGLKKSTIGERLAGVGLDEAFVSAVVEACTESPELLPLRQQYLVLGGRLWERTLRERSTVAVRAFKSPGDHEVVVTSLQKVIDAQERLLAVKDELALRQGQLVGAVRARSQAEDALRSAISLSAVLSTCIVVLADQMGYLSQQREAAASARPLDQVHLSYVEAELSWTLVQHQRTANDLRRVDGDRALAARILGESILRGRQLYQEVHRLRDVLGMEQDPSGVEHPAPVLDGLQTPDPFLDDVDFALDRAEQVSQAIAIQLRGAMADLGEDTTLARTPPSGSDNALTSTDCSDNSLWWDMLTEVPVEARQWAEAEAHLLLQDHDSADPRLPGLVEQRTTREIMLLADTLERFQWLEGAVRLRQELTRALATEELITMVGGLIQRGLGNHRSEHGRQLLTAAVWRWDPLAVANLLITFRSHSQQTWAQEHNSLEPFGEETWASIDRALAAAAWRPVEDVHAIVQEVVRVNSRLLTASPFATEVLNRPTDEVLTLLSMIEQSWPDRSVLWALLLHSLPRRERLFWNTELILHLWGRLQDMEERGPLLDSCLPKGSSEIAESFIRLHQLRSAGLLQAAEEMLSALVPVVIDISTMQDLRDLGTRLANAGLDPADVFEAHQHLLTVTFEGPGNPAGRMPIDWGRYTTPD